MIGKSILFSEMRPDPSWEDEFNAWYRDDHIPVRMVLDGFDGAQRYTARDDDNYLVVYDIQSMDALKTHGYQMVKNNPSEQTNWMLENVSNFTRNLGSELERHGDLQSAIEAPLIFAAMFNVPEAKISEFDDWMTQDHLPLLLECEDWLAVRRFELTVSEPTPFNRLAIHYLAGPGALTSPERGRARGTEWRERLGTEDWFTSGSAKVFEKFGPRYLGRNS